MPLRRRIEHHLIAMDDDEVRHWLAGIIATVLDLLILMLIAFVCGTYLLYTQEKGLEDQQRARDARRVVVDDRLQVVDNTQQKTACVVLHYIPPQPAPSLYHDLAVLYPQCVRK